MAPDETPPPDALQVELAPPAVVAVAVEVALVDATTKGGMDPTTAVPNPAGLMLVVGVPLDGPHPLAAAAFVEAEDAGREGPGEPEPCDGDPPDLIARKSARRPKLGARLDR